MEFDYVIVGAGSAGCVLAARLSEDPAVRVLLLEAGGHDRRMLVSVPLAWPRVVQKRMYDWQYTSEPEPNLNGRAIILPRGKIVGGCSSINGMVWARGNPADYDEWAALGAKGWSFDDVEPYFRKIENWEGEPSPARGTGGPMTVRKCPYDDPLNQSVAAAMARLGIPFNPDYNAGAQEGFAHTQQSIRGGRRSSAARAYLHPAIGRPNLHIETDAVAERIKIENGCATGVFYKGKAGAVFAAARREVIVASGALNSPQLLMLSGIGPGADLGKLGLDVVVDAPEVGQNLMDHCAVMTEYQRRDDGPFMALSRWDRLARDTLRAYLLGQGPATDVPTTGQLFARVDGKNGPPQLQFLLRPVARYAQPWFPGLIKRGESRFGCGIILLHPFSRGRIELRSPHAADNARVYLNMLDDERDRAVLRDGIRLGRKVFAEASLDPHRGEELLPGADCTSDEQLDAFLRDNTGTAHHAAGTCRMGSDARSVVDPQLRVRGVGNLRVIDASVMPAMPSGNTNAPTIMIAEKGADFIRGLDVH